MNEDPKGKVRNDEVKTSNSSRVTRRELMKASALAGVAMGVGGMMLGAPGVLQAAESAPIKFGLLEDRSGNFAIFGLNKWHGTQLAIKEINEGWTLDGGVQGPGGPGVYRLYQ